jgi:hypothetical protein
MDIVIIIISLSRSTLFLKPKLHMRAATKTSAGSVFCKLRKYPSWKLVLGYEPCVSWKQHVTSETVLLKSLMTGMTADFVFCFVHFERSISLQVQQFFSLLGTIFKEVIHK